MTSEYKSHYSVMSTNFEQYLKDNIENKAPKLADMTFGAGGHTFMMNRVFPKAKIYSVDQDPDALKNGHSKIKENSLEEQINLLTMNFESFPDWCNQNNQSDFDGIIADLGVSSHHFDKYERGFSFREDAPLDMRMNNADSDQETAAELIARLDEEELANVIFKYGEERLSRRIAKGIKDFESEKPLETTKELENICFHAYPPKQRHKGAHPATRTFQALRIAVNRELEVLENTIAKWFDLLAPGGVLMIISFHSLEDRIVKHSFKDIFQNDKNIAKILTKRPELPSEDELSENPRSRSAKLRVIKKTN